MLESQGFNPYFTGLPILIFLTKPSVIKLTKVSILILLDYLFLLEGTYLIINLKCMFQSLFYWITYSYELYKIFYRENSKSFNPYFTGLPILIILAAIQVNDREIESFNPYFTGLPILISG